MSDIIKMMDRGPVVSLWPQNNKYQAVRPESVVCSALVLFVTKKVSLDRFQMIHGETAKLLRWSENS